MSTDAKLDWQKNIASSSLISIQELNSLLGHRRVKIFDVRGTWSTPARALPEMYKVEHVVGARFIDWTKNFIEPDVAVGLASVADERGAEISFKNLGIDQGDLVVLYDDSSHMLAGRMWWAMRYWGFPDVRVLNGGWENWIAKSYPTSTETPDPSIGSFTPRMHADIKIDLDAFLETNGECCIIDARGPLSFGGNADDLRTGHIPGSKNVPFSALLNPETGVFLNNEAIIKVLDQQAPQWRDQPIIASCGSGYAATVLLLALSMLNRPAQLFDGSFAVWKQDARREVSQLLSN